MVRILPSIGLNVPEFTYRTEIRDLEDFRQLPLAEMAEAMNDALRLVLDRHRPEVGAMRKALRDKLREDTGLTLQDLAALDEQLRVNVHYKGYREILAIRDAYRRVARKP